MNLKRLLVVGVGTGAMCALLTAAGMSLGMVPPTWLLAGVAGLGGAIGATWAKAPKEPTEEAPPVSRQLVGARCTVCDKKLNVAVDAHHCDECGVPLHNECAQEHDHA